MNAAKAAIAAGNKMGKTLIVYNYNAGRKKGLKYRKKLQKFLFKLSASFKFISIDETKSVDFSDFDTILAMGGDGTVNKVIPGIIKNDKKLGILPCGTANLLAEKLGVSNSYSKSINILQNGNENKIDVMNINEEYSILRLGLGWDSDIICKTPQLLKHKFGYFAYFLAGIIFALRLKNKKYILEYDNKKIIVNASCIIVANSSNMYKNGVSISNNSKLNDGLFDVFILTTQNPLLFFIELLNIIFKNYKNTSRAMYFKTSKLNIQNKRMRAHVDGEEKIFQNNIEISIKKSILKVICPKEINKRES